MPKIPMKKKLDRLHKKYSQLSQLRFDPLYLLDRTLCPADQEIISFLLAGLAYGRVEQIQKSSRALLACLEKSGCGPSGAEIHRLLLDPAFHKKALLNLKGWKHRLNTQSDLTRLFLILSKALGDSTSLKSFMAKSVGKTSTETLVSFASRLDKLDAASGKSAVSNRKGAWGGTGPSWFFANPEDGSSCKRLMLWLRWMVRKSDVDPGTWHRLDQQKMPIEQAALMIPLDVHVFRWAKKEKITRYKSPSWKAVEEISNHLRTLEPRDPLRYDFAIFQDSFQKLRAEKN
jgi:uncharacterized protein (TIGR02757 family)